MFKPEYATVDVFVKRKKQPDFKNLLKVLSKEKPNRYTLFEFFMNDNVYNAFEPDGLKKDEYYGCRKAMYAYYTLGYDYYTTNSSGFYFTSKQRDAKKSVSLNGGVISNRADYEAYKWFDPEDFGTVIIEKIEGDLPEGMKLIVSGPCGVLENLIAIIGYEELCYMLNEDRELVKIVCDDIGSRLVKYYELALEHDSVGAIISNDDWGFNTQTMLSVADMREFIFPWHKKIADAAHKKNKPVILHSCGQLNSVYGDIIDDMKFDGKHSFEDNIEKIEDVYNRLKGKIALLGGIDLDFVCRNTPEKIFNRSRRMLELAVDGGYALGSGNSIPYYVPLENYLAMLSAALFE